MAQCGSYHTVVVDSNGFIWVFGENHQGQLGIEQESCCLTPTINYKVPKIAMVSCMNFSTVCLDTQGFVWTFGNNKFGQLGIGTTQNTTKPTRIQSTFKMPRFVASSSGSSHTICLGDDHSIWGFGSNKFGQLGINESWNGEKISPFPQKLLLNDIFTISSGGNYTFALDCNGDLFSTGLNDHGQLGHGNYVNYASFTKIRFALPEDVKFISIASGTIHTLLLTSNGTVYGTGTTANGRLGSAAKLRYCTIPSKFKLNQIIKISCGFRHSMFVDEDYNLWACGFNTNGELGIGNRDSVVIEIKLRENINSISQGGSHSIFHDFKEQEILVSGLNISGQLGIGSSDTCITSTALNQEFSNILHIPQPRAKSARK